MTLDNLTFPETKEHVATVSAIEAALQTAIAGAAATCHRLRQEKEAEGTPFYRQREIANELTIIEPWLRDRGWLNV
jgi:hypothetical protein